jgi:hypothetical protein
MMQLGRCASLVVLLLLASGGRASAECAWVLWLNISVVNVEPEKSMTEDYVRLFAVPAHRECIANAAEKARDSYKRLKDPLRNIQRRFHTTRSSLCL